MKVLLALASVLLHLGPITCFSISQRLSPLSKRFSEYDTGNIGCIHMESFDGEYWYRSTGGEEAAPGGVCGLFLIGLPEQLIQITFEDFDIDCESGGLLAIVDGWETQGQFFPSDYDHPLPFEMRYRTFCGEKSPTSFVSSQNVALIQFRIPAKGQGFRINLKFIPNPEPCNMVTMMEEGVMTLKNYGHRRNCSVSIMYPEKVKVLNIDIGHTTEIPHQLRESGITHHCKKRLEQDYVEMLVGTGLDTSIMPTVLDVCGQDTKPDLLSVPLSCGHSVVRLVSSGHFYNAVTFSFSPLSEAAIMKYMAKQCVAV